MEALFKTLFIFVVVAGGYAVLGMIAAAVEKGCEWLDRKMDKTCRKGLR